MIQIYFLRFFPISSGKSLRFVAAKSRNCCSVMDCSILLEAPFNELTGRLPRFAANAAPAAYCWTFERAGMIVSFQARRKKTFENMAEKTKTAFSGTVF